MEFIIHGIVREEESGQPIPGLLVRAFDRDLLFTDLLGTAITQANGSFVLGYQGVDFRDLFEQRPDIYLDIYGSKIANDPASSQTPPIYTTRQRVRFNAGRREFFLIKIPRDQLGEDAPGHDIIEPPQEGLWKDAVDAYIKDHPVDFTYDPNKGFMKPLLSIDLPNLPGEFPWQSAMGGETNNPTFYITNYGNGVSFNTYVELYLGPEVMQHPLREYKLCDYKVTAINPGQKIGVELTYTRPHGAFRIVGICYDPFLDPRGFEVIEQNHPHIASVVSYGF